MSKFQGTLGGLDKAYGVSTAAGPSTTEDVEATGHEFVRDYVECVVQAASFVVGGSAQVRSPEDASEVVEVEGGSYLVLADLPDAHFIVQVEGTQKLEICSHEGKVRGRYTTFVEAVEAAMALDF